MQGEQKGKKIILDILIIFFIVVAAVCGSISFLHFDQLKKNERAYEELSHKSYVELKKQNPDMVAWLKMPKTKINYPVMYTPNEPEFYLSRNFKKEFSISGSLFVAGDTDLELTHNILIYGHHMMDGTMFGNLSKYIGEGKDTFVLDYLLDDEGKTYERRRYRVISAFKTSTNSPEPYYYYQEIEDNEAFEKYKEIFTKSNELNNEFHTEYPDDLLTLSTCSYHLWYNGRLDHSGRYVVVARKYKTEFIRSE